MSFSEAPPEKVYFKHRGLQVTASSLNVSGDSYPLISILSFELHKKQPSRTQPLLLIFVGVLFILFVVGLIPIAIGIYWLWQQKPTYWLVITTRAGTKTLTKTQEAEILPELEAALNMAIALSQAKLKLLDAAHKRGGTLAMRHAITTTGLPISKVQPLLDSLVHEGYVQRLADPLLSDVATYDFSATLAVLTQVLQVAKVKQKDLSIREIAVATGLSTDQVQLILNLLSDCGYTRVMRDRYGGISYRFEVQP